MRQLIFLLCFLPARCISANSCSFRNVHQMFWPPLLLAGGGIRLMKYHSMNTVLIRMCGLWTLHEQQTMQIYTIPTILHIPYSQCKYTQYLHIPYSQYPHIPYTQYPHTPYTQYPHIPYSQSNIHNTYIFLIHNLIYTIPTYSLFTI